MTEVRSNVEIAGYPLELWVPAALFAAAGIYVVQLSLRALPDTFRLFRIDGFPKSYATALLLVILLVAAFGAGVVVVAGLLFNGDRIGRGLAYLAAAALAGIVVFGDGTTTGEVLAMFGGLVAAAFLAFAPTVRDVFESGPQHDQPTSIVVARVALLVWSILLAVGAVVDFCLSSLAGKYAVYGVILAAIAVAACVLFARLRNADPAVRTIVSIAAAAALLFLLLGQHNGATAFLVGLTAAIPACLWVPSDARRFYGDEPLVVRQPA